VFIRVNQSRLAVDQWLMPFAFKLRSFEPNRRQFPALPIPRDYGDFGDPGDFFEQPHPGVALLLKTNAQPQFDKTVTRQSTPFFCLFSVPNPVASLCLCSLL